MSEKLELLFNRSKYELKIRILTLAPRWWQERRTENLSLSMKQQSHLITLNVKLGVQMQLQLCPKRLEGCSSPWAHRKWCRNVRKLAHRDWCANTIHLHLRFAFISHPSGISHPSLQSVHVQAGTQTQPLVHAACICRSMWLKLTLYVNTPITNPHYLLT